MHEITLSQRALEIIEQQAQQAARGGLPACGLRSAHFPAWKPAP